VLRLPPGTEDVVVRTAAGPGLLVSGMAEFRHEAVNEPCDDALVVNDTVVADRAWPAALDALRRAMP